ncbi:class II histone deacetylase [Microbacterium sp. RD1]|uniref:class II histone deacetylase n=1 Tax=Microbacterium sp. RD1 TaxID=3457313 RepID=UPI003FA5F6DF
MRRMTMSPRRTGFAWHELFAWYDLGTGAAWMHPSLVIEPMTHVDSPETRRRIRSLLEVSNLLDQLTALKPRPATDEELLRYHEPEYLDRLAEMSRSGGGEAGELSSFGAGGYEIARLATGGCLVAVDAVLRGETDNAYALVRPNGHHVEPSRGRGHGILANIACAALHARAVHGVRRIAVIDWDVHHGNGTEDAFYDDPDVLTISLHQDNAYPPGRGRIEDAGIGEGLGANINVPLPPGSSGGAYLYAFEQLVVPAVTRHRPELILVASGVDGSQLDPNGRMMLTSASFRAMTELTMQLAADSAQGRLVMCHEGGYSAPYAPFCGLAMLEALSGIASDIEDPFLDALLAGDPGLLPHQMEVVDRIRSTHPAFSSSSR